VRHHTTATCRISWSPERSNKLGDSVRRSRAIFWRSGSLCKGTDHLLYATANPQA
jgi:hypothetical protein